MYMRNDMPPWVTVTLRHSKLPEVDSGGLPGLAELSWQSMGESEVVVMSGSEVVQTVATAAGEAVGMPWLPPRHAMSASEVALLQPSVAHTMARE